MKNRPGKGTESVEQELLPVQMLSLHKEHLNRDQAKVLGAFESRADRICWWI